MIGLCHVCLRSGIETTTSKGRVFCKDCTNPIVSQPLISTNMLPFEDLPQYSEEERTIHLERISNDTFDRIFHKKMNSERVNEVIDKGY